VGRGVWFGTVDDQVLSRVGGQRCRLEGKLEVADLGVVDALGAGDVGADVVGGPPDPEVVAAGGQRADQVGELPVVGIAAG
jgi:hypothetical protein